MIHRPQLAQMVFARLLVAGDVAPYKAQLTSTLISWLFDFPHSLAFPSRKANTFHDQATSTASSTTPAPPPGSSSRRDARSRPSRVWMALFPLRRMINCLSFSTAFGGVDSGVFRLLATMEIRSVGSVKRKGGEAGRGRSKDSNLGWWK